jgi:hypothetical protein
VDHATRAGPDDGNLTGADIVIDGGLTPIR